MRGQHRQAAGQVGGLVDHGQVTSQPGGLGDDVGVLGVGLAFAGDAELITDTRRPYAYRTCWPAWVSNASSSADGAPTMSTAHCAVPPSVTTAAMSSSIST